MWVATSFGFLMPAIRPLHTVKAGDDRTLQVRARRAKDLDILRAEYMKGKLGPTIHTPKFDYEYRAYCTPEAFAFAMARMVTEIDYTKFKPTTDRYEDDELHTLYNRIWSVVLNGLSTKWHQWDYWRKNPSAKTESGTGYPKAVGGGKAVETVGSVSFVDSEQERLDEWLGRRSTAADRDSYEPDVTWGDDDVAVVSAGNPIADALYAEIDAILDGQNKSSPTDHTACEHEATARENGKCRARRRKAEEKRVEEIRRLIDESYEDYKADLTTESDQTAESDDPESWKGFAWEGKPKG